VTLTRQREMIPLYLALGLSLAGCRTTRTLIGTDRRTARFKFTSDPAGAEARINGKSVGQTPVDVRLDYEEGQVKVNHGERRSAWLTLGTGIGAFVLGGALLGTGLALHAQDEYSDGVLLAVPGSIMAAYSVYGIIHGAVSMAHSRAPEVTTVTEPDALNLKLVLPDGQKRSARIAARSQNFRQGDIYKLDRIHYSEPLRQWSVPGLSDWVQLSVLKRRKKRRGERRRRAPPRPAGSSPVVAVFDIEDKGAGLSDAVRSRLSEYLAMQLASTGAFQVVPRDQLKERLATKKRESYRDCYARSCQIEIGRELAAQKSLSTMVVKLGSRCVVTAVLFDLLKAASEGGASAKGGCSEDGIVTSLERMVRQLAR
jgi:hypothetical protein